MTGATDARKTALIRAVDASEREIDRIWAKLGDAQVKAGMAEEALGDAQSDLWDAEYIVSELEQELEDAQRARDGNVERYEQETGVYDRE